jgi:hypothetical protein
VYGSSVQTAALTLIARKVHSSNLFDGDLSAGGLDEMVEDESLVALAKQLLDRDVPQDGALEELFARRELMVNAEDAFLDCSFTEEAAAFDAAPERAASAASAGRVIQVAFTPEQANTLNRLIEEHERLRAEELERARELATRRREARVSSGQLVLFPEAA